MVLRTRAILITNDDKILLVKVKGMAHFSLPGGRVEKGESTHEAMRRELAEELGLTVGSQQLHLRYIVELPHINSFETYYALRIDEDSVDVDNASHFHEELDEIGVFPLDTSDIVYYPKWLRHHTVEDILQGPLEYLGVCS